MTLLERLQAAGVPEKAAHIVERAHALGTIKAAQELGITQAGLSFRVERVLKDLRAQGHHALATELER